MEKEIDEGGDSEIGSVEDSGVHEDERLFLIDSAHEGHCAEHEGHVFHTHGEVGFCWEWRGKEGWTMVEMRMGNKQQ